MARKSRKVDVPLAIVSLALGLGVWLYAQTQQAQNIERRLDVRLAHSRIAEGLEITSIPEKVSLYVSGAPGEVEKVIAGIGRVRAYVDLANAEPGSHEYPVAVDDPTRVLANVNWNYDRRALVRTEEKETRRLTVEVEPIGESPSGLKLGAATVEPEMVTISGPRTLVARVHKAFVQLDMAEARSGEATRLKVFVLDADGNAVGSAATNPPEVTVTPVLSATEPRRTLLVSPNWRGQPEPGFRVAKVEIEPAQVTVQGDRTRLGDRLIVETESIDLSGLKETTTRIVELVFPPGVRPLGPRRVNVRIRIEPVPLEAATLVPPL